VFRGPYEYASPDTEEDYLPQTQSLNGHPVSGQPVVHH